MYAAGESSIKHFPVAFVWGVDPVAHGSAVDPDAPDKNDVTYVDLSGDWASKEWQAYLVEFCTTVRKQGFYKRDEKVGDVCAPELLKRWVEFPCANTTMDVPAAAVTMDRAPPAFPRRVECCARQDGTPTFPLEEDAYRTCLGRLTDVANEVYGAAGAPTGMLYRGDGSGELAAVVVTFGSSRAYSNAFAAGKEVYDELNAFTDGQLAGAPRGLERGFWATNAFYFSLQQALVQGTLRSTVLSVLVALLVLLCMTRNWAIALLASLCIVAIVVAEVGLLVLMGWALGVVPSIIFSVAVGMSVDFVSHLAHAYAHAGKGADRNRRVTVALTSLGVSISTAALSTALAGLVMMGSDVLFYKQFGQFMATVMVLSWTFALGMLLPLLAICGPEKGCGLGPPKAATPSLLRYASLSPRGSSQDHLADLLAGWGEDGRDSPVLVGDA